MSSEEERIERAAKAIMRDPDMMIYGKAVDLAKAAIAAYLGDDHVVVPREDLKLIESMLTIEALSPAEHEFEREKRRKAWEKIRAMIRASNGGA